jgi:hypothetical protein
LLVTDFMSDKLKITTFYTQHSINRVKNSTTGVVVPPEFKVSFNSF